MEWNTENHSRGMDIMLRTATLTRRDQDKHFYKVGRDSRGMAAGWPRDMIKRRTRVDAGLKKPLLNLQ